MRLAVLASGRGSNLRALLEASRGGRLASRVVGVFSDRAKAPALAVAREYSVTAEALNPADFADRVAYDDAFFDAVAGVQPDLIVCAGYMRLISDRAVRRFQGKMINIHPSLLPAYPGLDTHARVLASGDAETGASVHVVTPELDGGPVLAQARVPVQAGDDAAALAARVLGVEHELLVQVVGAIERGELDASAVPPRWNGIALTAPLRAGAAGRLEVRA
jgi:phosphoribosylglycinamide formyltransferase 1